MDSFSTELIEVEIIYTYMLICMSLDCGRKSEVPRGNPPSMVRTYKLAVHTGGIHTHGFENDVHNLAKR